VIFEIWGPTPWTTVARHQLQEEIKKGVPWWAILRSYWCLPLYVLLATIVAGWSAWPGGNHVEEDGLAAFSFVAVAVWLVLICVFVFFAHWRLRGFELTAVGDRAVGSRIMEALLLLVATGALTVLLAGVTK
jgi:hypothetical protein